MGQDIALLGALAVCGVFWIGSLVLLVNEAMHLLRAWRKRP